MAEDHEDAKWLRAFILGLLLGVLLAVGASGYFVMINQRRAMEEAAIARQIAEDARNRAELAHKESEAQWRRLEGTFRPWIEEAWEALNRAMRERSEAEVRLQQVEKALKEGGKGKE